jgi:glutathione synthase/RimK-type ligase-like ATP-grasp enzyme
MPSPIALLTDARYLAPLASDGDTYLANILEEDRLLASALRAHGIETVRVDWADPTVDWGSFRAAVFRTTWDYHDRVDAFLGWLKDTEQKTALLNPPDLVRWNLDKRYLVELAHRGLPVIPTRILEVESAPRPLYEIIKTVQQETGWNEMILKPRISGGARLTFRVTPETANSVDSQLAGARERESFLLQPFLPSVLDQGEVTLVAFDGTVTHAIRKRAKPGDFRVQDDHGGTVHPHTATRAERAVAEAAFAALTPAPAYGRIDLVRGEDGTPRIMELELIEPELWLRFHPPAAHAFAQALLARIP